MPDVTIPATGSFCWVDLQTTDPASARRFYADVLGWTITDMPGPTPYGVASIDDKMTAGIMELPARAKAMGAPPHWLSYIAVDDVQAATDRAIALGGAALMPPTTMGPGTFAVLRDPTGGVFAIWHSPVSMGTSLYREVGSPGWNELISTNAAAAEKFYTSLFGWTAESANMPGLKYTILKNGSDGIAGLLAMPNDAPPGTPSYWCVYFVVDDADETFEAATSRGAQVVMPLMDMPTVGRFGFLADPQGASFAVITFEGEAS